MSNIFVYGLYLPLYLMFVDDIAIQKGKLFDIIWLLNCTSDEADEVLVHKRLYYVVREMYYNISRNTMGSLMETVSSFSRLMVSLSLPVSPVSHPCVMHSFLDEDTNLGKNVVFS